MHPFTLSRPADTSAAITAHAYDAHLAFIAGGTALIGLMKDRVTLPDRLLDINHLPDMAQIEALHDGGLRLGSLARMSDVAANLDVRSRFPVIAESLLFAASGQLRNMATMAGTSCSGLAARTFVMKTTSLATNGGPAPVVRRDMGSITISRSSGGPMTA